LMMVKESAAVAVPATDRITSSESAVVTREPAPPAEAL
jgi:hypothetical protein